jgi:hypothetical protein
VKLHPLDYYVKSLNKVNKTLQYEMDNIFTIPDVQWCIIIQYIAWIVWRYQRGNQNPYIEEEQTTQWPKEKVYKDKQKSTKQW